MFYFTIYLSLVAYILERDVYTGYKTNFIGDFYINAINNFNWDFNRRSWSCGGEDRVF